MTILAAWQRLSLAYKLKHKSVLDFAESLYKSLFRRKQLYLNADQDEHLKIEDELKLFEDCKRHTELIKVLTVCCIVMEYTRKLSNAEKQPLKAFCEKVIKSRYTALQLEEMNYP
jgi:hypothetical protein